MCYNQKMITLRNATSTDVVTLQNLNDEVFIDNYKYDVDLVMGWAKGPTGLKYFSELIENRDALCIIAEEDKVPIGYLAGSPHPISYRKSKYVELENMGVITTYRSQGVGSLLMVEFSKWAQEHGFDKILVNAYSTNIGAIDFYKRNGFEVIDITLEKIL